jgi:hypothetical protein
VCSNLSLFDRATIEPSLHALYNKNNCEERVKALVKRGIPSTTAKANVKKGCCEHKKHAENDMFEYWLCPCHYKNGLTPYLIRAAVSLKQGILPYSGGYLEQPAQLMEALEIVNSFLQEQEQKEMEAEQKKAKQSQKK